jgi:tetratricopeptide (TPR) repeat protein
MNRHISRDLLAILFLAMPLAACVSTTTNLFRGDMELVTVSGDACSEKERANSHIPLELVLETKSSLSGQLISGYLTGPEIQTGQFSGDNIAHLQIIYPDESGSIEKGHTLELLPTPDGVNGELREKPQGTSSGCYFEKAVLRLKNASIDGDAKAAIDHQRKLFNAEAHYNRGQVLLKTNNPEEALHDLKESLRLRYEVEPNDPKWVYPATSIAIAHVMAGREGEALEILRDLFKGKPKTGIDILQQRIAVSGVICASTYEASGDELQKAAEQLMDTVAREFSGLNGVGDVLDACYRELGLERFEQGDPDQSVEYFRKALKLNPKDTDSIFGVVAGFIASDAPAEGRIFLQKHAQIVIEKAGRVVYNTGLSHLYAAEAKQAEKSRDYARAEQLLREALKILPGEHARIISLATVLEKAAKPDEARKLLEEAKKGCSDETCRLEYADELVRQERIERIVKRLDRK